MAPRGDRRCTQGIRPRTAPRAPRCAAARPRSDARAARSPAFRGAWARRVRSRGLPPLSTFLSAEHVPRACRRMERS